MLVKNPYRHFPKLTARIVYADGSVVVYRTVAESEQLYFPGEKDDILAVAVVAQDAGSRPVGEAMWVDDQWLDYDEKRLNQIEHDAQKEDEPDPWPEPEPEPVVEDEPESEPWSEPESRWHDADDEEKVSKDVASEDE